MSIGSQYILVGTKNGNIYEMVIPNNSTAKKGLNLIC